MDIKAKSHFETDPEAFAADSKEGFTNIFGERVEGEEKDNPKAFRKIMANLDDNQSRDVCSIMLQLHPEIYLDTLKATYISKISVLEGITGSINIHQNKITDLLGGEE